MSLVPFSSSVIGLNLTSLATVLLVCTDWSGTFWLVPVSRLGSKSDDMEIGTFEMKESTSSKLKSEISEM